MLLILQALDLHPVDLNGLADPYLIVRCGNNKVNDKEHKILNSLNPVFGRYVKPYSHGTNYRYSTNSSSVQFGSARAM